MFSFYIQFQLWVLIIFALLIGVRILYLRFRKGINAVPLIKGKGKQRVLVILTVSLINIWVAALLLYILHPEIQYLPSNLDIMLIDYSPAKVAGVSIISFGLAIYTAAWIALRNAWRIGQDDNMSSGLVTYGIYRVSRNPMYLFYMLYFIGTFLMNGYLIFLVLAAILAITLHHLILEEEKSLFIAYGATYKHYSSVTSRYITLII